MAREIEACPNCGGIVEIIRMLNGRKVIKRCKKCGYMEG